MTDPSTYSILEVDFNIIEDNYKYLRELVFPSECAAAIKADAYGFGVSHIAPLLQNQGCNHFFVAYLDEGIDLRKYVKSSTNIYVLNSLFPNTEQTFLEQRLIPVLHSVETFEIWQNFAHKIEKVLPCVIHIDTGMSRTGILPKDLDQIRNLDGLNVRLIMSHLTTSDVPTHPMNQKQLDDFINASEKFPDVPLSFCNSDGIFLGRQYHLDMVRPGVGLYGLSSCGQTKLKFPLRFWSRVLQVQEVDEGDSIGYYNTYTLTEKKRIATIASGYADGIPRLLSNKGYVLIAGQKAPIVGRISMDLITIDVSDIKENITNETFALVLGDEITGEVWSQQCGSFVYETMISMRHRTKRVFTYQKNALSHKGLEVIS